MYRKSLKALIMAFALVYAFEASADAYSRISLSEVNTPVEDVLKKIEKEAKCLFVFNTQVDTQRKVNLNVKNKTVSEVLDIMFKGTDVSYSIQNPNIMLSKRAVAQEQGKGNKSAATAAQATNGSRIVTGNVTDASGETLIGLTVKVAGTSVATATDIDGNYSIKVPAGSNELEFSYIGYQTVKQPINGKDKIDIVMRDNTKLLDEVVVTAMGIARKEETLSYSTQTVGGDELTRAKEANLINSLQGKSAGLVITPNSGGAGGASKILLRGNASMLGNNSPLIVIDGVPMQNSVNGLMDMDGGGATMMADGSKESSDALSQLNPDDIESITVLKGANSAALYGSAASNGVLMITTKKGKEGQLRIDVSSSTTFETPLKLPQIQSVYGAQMSGSVENGFSMGSYSWGQRMNSLGNEYYDTANSPYHLTRNSYDISDFYRTGTNFNNSISLSGGTKVAQTYFSYGNTTANGIVETNKFERHNIALRQSFSFFKDKLKIDISANYINQKTKNRPTGGTFFNPIYQLYTSPRNLDMNWYRKNYYDTNATWESNPYSYIVSQVGSNGMPISVIENGRTALSDSNYGKQVWFTDAINLNNPWWLLNRMTSEEVINRTFGSITANWQIIPDLNLQARIKYDYNERNDESRQYASTWGNAEMIDRGRLILDHTKSSDFYGDFMLSYNKQIQDFTIGVNAGGSMMNSSYDQWMITPIAKSGAPYTEDHSCNQFVLSDIYINSSDNYGGLTTKNWERAIFATAQVTWQDKVTVEGSYRDDWYRAFTQFKDMDPHFAYYSAGASAQMNKLLSLPDQINELKLRASYSEVGNSIPNNLFLASASRNPATGAYISSAIINFKDPKPETTQSFEAGFDVSLLDRSISLQATYYNAIMKNQFMKYEGAAGKEIYINGGKVRNQGVELTASYIFAPNNDFSWITTFNYAYNDNKILTVARKQNGQKYIHEVDMGNLSGLKIKFEEGGSYGDLYAVDFMRDEITGEIVVDPDTGAPFKLNGQANEYLGNMNAKHTLGWSNTFNYKDLSFYFLIDGKVGGKVISFTEAYLDQFGTSQRTAEARDLAIANNLYWTSEDGTITKPAMYIPGTNTLVPVDQYYQTIGGGSPVGRNYVYDATNFRLREISLAYTFRNLFGPSKNLTVSANARNLFFLYINAPIDPDTSLSTQNALGNVDIFSMPTTRSFGISLKASF